jgi:hypothetical protein
MKLFTVAFVFAGTLSFAAIGASAPAVAAVARTVDWTAAASDRHGEREAPPEPVDLHHIRGDLAILVSVDDVKERSRKAMQERVAFL